jgi:hypothetical protein
MSQPVVYTCLFDLAFTYYDFLAFFPDIIGVNYIACVCLKGPPLFEMGDLVYTPEDDAAIENFVYEGEGI